MTDARRSVGPPAWNLSAWAIAHPRATFALFLLLSVAGLWSFRALPVQDFPDVELPGVTVSVPAPGLPLARLEGEVVPRFENALASVPGVRHLSTSVRDGGAVIALEFDLATSRRAALEATREAVAGVRADQPAEVQAPVVAGQHLASTPILALALRSSQRDEAALTQLLDRSLVPVLRAVPGVGAVSRVGGRERVLRVQFDAERLSALRLDPSAVARRLHDQARALAAGVVAPGGQGQVLTVAAGAGSLEALAGLRLSLTEGRSVRLDAVATITEDLAPATSLARLGPTPVVALEIARRREAGDLAVVGGVQAALAAWQRQHPDVQVDVAFDSVRAVRENYQGSLWLLLEGALLAVVVVALFLRDARATLIAATALPLSVLPTFALMHLAGFSLNLVTLLSLSLVVGVLVDDAIVEIENIARHRAQGKSAARAAREAADEIGVAVIATTVTLVAVFLPTAFMGGVAGRFFVQFGWTAAIAVLASLLVARMLTPLMAARWLREGARRGAPSASSASPAWQRLYLRWVRTALTHRGASLLVAGLLCLGGAVQLMHRETSFMPADDGAQTQVRLELPPGASLAQTDAAAQAVRGRVLSHPLVQQVYTTVGDGAAGNDSLDTIALPDTRRAILTVALVPREARRGVTLAAVESQLRERLRDEVGVRVLVGAPGSADRHVLVLQGADALALQAQALRIVAEVQTLPGVGPVTAEVQLHKSVLALRVDAERAASLGVSATAIAETLRAATGSGFDAGGQALRLDTPAGPRAVLLGLAPTQRDDLDALRGLWVGGDAGPVRLGEVASLHPTLQAALVERYDRQRSVRLEIDPGSRTLSEVEVAVAALPSVRALPPGLRLVAVGDTEAMDELFDGFLLAMGLGLVGVVSVLVLLFKDGLQPFTVLVALALALPGAALALGVARLPLSMPALIGLVMLMGVTTKNAILLIDRALVARRDHGMGRRAAMLLACEQRVRPIVMTTVAMAAGMLPVALGLGTDPGFRAPMAVVVLGGLLTSTLLSLLVVPVAFVAIDDARRLLTGGPRPASARS